jgi:5-formyltetrahydrofolate cyclo-ligase
LEKSDLIEKKRQTRVECRKKISEISSDSWLKYGREMAALLFETDMWKQAKSIFCFVSMPNEPDTSFILQEALIHGKTLCVPRIIGHGIMETVVLRSADELVKGKMGIYEPDKTLKELLDFSEIELAVIPCLSVAENGSRLGRGGGYYDRFLEKFRGTSIAICAEKLILPASEIPIEEHDKKADFILTENMLKKSSAR